jgi:hypothetical protein
MSTHYYDDIFVSIICRSQGPALLVIKQVFSDLDIDQGATFPTTKFDFQDVDSSLEQQKQADPTKALSIGMRAKFKNLTHLINDGKAPTAYPPNAGEWLDSFTVNNSVKPPSDRPTQPVQTKLDKSPVSIDGFIVDKNLTTIEQAQSLIIRLKACFTPQHASGKKLVSTARGPDGKLLQVNMETDGLEEQMNRNLHAALTTIIHNSSCLKDRIPDAATGRELWMNTLNVLIPPDETNEASINLQIKLASLKYDDFDTPEDLLAARNAIIRQLIEFGREATIENKYITLITAIPQEATFLPLLVQFKNITPNAELYTKLEVNFLQWARLAPKEKASTTIAVRAATKKDEAEEINNFTRLINALEVGGRNRKGAGRGKGNQPQGQGDRRNATRASTYISPENYTPEVKKELDDRVGAKYDEIRDIRLKFIKEKGFQQEEAKGARVKGTQAAPDVRTASRLCVRPTESNDNTASPLTAFTASKVFDNIPEDLYDESLYDF